MNSSLNNLWWKWTTHEGLLTFFGEDNLMKLEIGGPFEIYFSRNAPLGFRGSEKCKVISYLPKSMLSFSWNAPPTFPEIRNRDYFTWVVVNFKPFNRDQTETEINHLGWPADKEWEGVYGYFDKAWTTVLDWLEKSCKEK